MEWIKNHWFLLLMLVISTALSFVWLFVFNRKRLNLTWWECLIISLLSFALGFVGAVVLHFFENGFSFSNIGTSAFGAIFVSPLVALLASIVFKKHDFLGLTDVVTIIVAIFMIVVRINCLRAGCCYGIKLGNTDYRWPAREIDILFQVLFIVFAAPTLVLNKRRGFWMPFYFISYGMFRFFNEWFREADAGHLLHDGHIWSIIAFATGIIWTIIQKHKKRKETLNNEPIY